MWDLLTSGDFFVTVATEWLLLVTDGLLVVSRTGCFTTGRLVAAEVCGRAAGMAGFGETGATADFLRQGARERLSDD